MDDRSFERFGGICAVLTAGASVGFAAALGMAGRTATSPDMASMRLQTPAANWFFAIMGLLATAAIVALYFRLSESGAAWAFWGAAMGLFASIMTALHGVYDALRYDNLNAIWNLGEASYQAVLRTLSYIPNSVDPRGIGSLFLMGLFALVMGLLIVRGERLSRALGYLGIVWAIALFLLFVTGLFDFGRDIPFIRTSLGAIAFGVVGPAWWLLVGRDLLKGDSGE